jgi:hypothetical protein
VVIINDFSYTREDFDTPAPYEYLSGIKDPFQQGTEERRLSEYAKSVGFRSFKTAFRQYKESIKAVAENGIGRPDGITQFDEQAMELDTGDWTADDTGVWKYGGLGGIEVAAPSDHAGAAIEKHRHGRAEDPPGVPARREAAQSLE